MTRRHAERTDGELATLACAGETAAFAEIVSRHKAPLHATVTRLTGDAHEAVDIVQDAFVAAHAALARFDPEWPMRTWLTRIAVNKARDWRRRGLVRRLISAVLPDAAGEVRADEPAVDAVVSDRAELARVTAAIARLSPPLREVLVLRAIDGLSQAETAEVLDISAKAVETRLYRARGKLRDDLDR